eukprot:1259695-Rhodomonas_salina.2
MWYQLAAALPRVTVEVDVQGVQENKPLQSLELCCDYRDPGSGKSRLTHCCAAATIVLLITGITGLMTLATCTSGWVARRLKCGPGNLKQVATATGITRYLLLLVLVADEKESSGTGSRPSFIIDTTTSSSTTSSSRKRVRTVTWGKSRRGMRRTAF